MSEDYKEWNIADKALEAIEKIVALEDPDEKNPILMKIYMLAHCANKHHSCFYVHDDWRKGVDETLKQLQDI